MLKPGAPLSLVTSNGDGKVRAPQRAGVSFRSVRATAKMTNLDTSTKLNEPGGLARHLGLFGTTMAVMGGIIGAGIFINPYLVADRVHTSALILSAWIAGGLIALLGGFVYAELATRLPVVGGQYAEYSRR